MTTNDTASAWRSLLFVPAHVEKFIVRAHERGADVVILDLEDAVPPDQKDAARDALPRSVAAAGASGAAVAVRVNHGLRALVHDLEAAVISGVSALVLPKVETAGFVEDVAEVVAELERERGLVACALRFLIQIETPRALPNLAAIAASHPRVAAMTLGPEDFCAALGAEPVPDALLAPNLAVLQAARAAGITPLGFVGSIGNFGDLDMFRAMIAQARSLGFRGAMAVHPAQVAILNAGFSPTADEIAWAHRVIEGAEAARAEGRGAFAVDSRMVDAPVIRRANQILRRPPP